MKTMVDQIWLGSYKLWFVEMDPKNGTSENSQRFPFLSKEEKDQKTIQITDKQRWDIKDYV